MSDHLRNIRLEKLRRLRELGVDPFPPKVPPRQPAAEVLSLAEKKAGAPAAIAGRILALRRFGKLAFAKLRDASGEIQVVLREGEVALARGEGESPTPSAEIFPPLFPAIQKFFARHGCTRTIHFERTAHWLRELKPDASEELLTAAWLHDFDRVVPKNEEEEAARKKMTWEESLKAHPRRSAALVKDFLEEEGVPAAFIEKVCELVAHHTTGGGKDPDADFLCDADAISILEVQAPYFLETKWESWGADKIRRKFEWTFNEKIKSDRARELARPFYEKAMADLSLKALPFPELCGLLDRGDFLFATGETAKTKTGEPSLAARELRVLSKSLRPLPDKWQGLKDDDLRYRRRELDLLLNSEARRAVETFAAIEREMREFFWQEGFTEFRVPVLENVATGAAAKPFVTHINAYDQDVFLRIASGEVPLKKLAVAGFEKTFHLGPIFRNEGVDAGHNPEFSMLEAYWAFHNYLDMTALMEKCYARLFQKIAAGKPIERDGELLNLKPPFPRKTFIELLAAEGILWGTFAKKPEKEKVSLVKKEAAARKISLEGKVSFAEMIDEIYKKTARPKLRQPTWVLDYPRELIPLAKRHPRAPELIQSAQLVVQGSELVKLYSELTDPEEQAANFAEQSAAEAEGAEEAFSADGDFVEAMEYGMPPMVGMGVGVETTARIFAGVPDLREVILFPFVKPGGKGAGVAKEEKKEAGKTPLSSKALSKAKDF